MRLTFPLPFLLLFAGNLLASGAFAQNNPSSVSIPVEVQEAISLYHQTFGRNAPLYSGSEYIQYTRPTKGHQYFQTKEWERGSVFFDGLLYSNVPILYDIVKDELVIGYAEETDPLVSFVVPPQQIAYFSLPSHHFIKIADPTGGAPTGFYEELYKGQVQVLAKRRKTVSDRPALITFHEADHYYIFKEGHYYPVKSLGSVLKVLKEHRRPLETFLKEKNFRFKEGREKALVLLAQQYDSLSGTK